LRCPRTASRVAVRAERGERPRAFHVERGSPVEGRRRRHDEVIFRKDDVGTPACFSARRLASDGVPLSKTAPSTTRPVRLFKSVADNESCWRTSSQIRGRPGSEVNVRGRRGERLVQRAQRAPAKGRAEEGVHRSRLRDGVERAVVALRVIAEEGWCARSRSTAIERLACSHEEGSMVSTRSTRSGWSAAVD